MKKTAIIYGSSTGTCEAIAQKICEKLGGGDVINVGELDAAQLADYDNLLLGTSTWGIGELQDDWYDGVDKLKGADLSGKTIALFGCGDCQSYGDSFCGAMAEIYDAVKDSGASIVGAVSTDGYDFSDSAAVQDGKFVGLALDDINEDDKTDARIDAWLADITPSL